MCKIAVPEENAVKLVFIHHSCGRNWLADDNGGLGIALMENNYYVSDTNYGWGPDNIGDRTDIGHWWSWFRGPDRERYLDSLYVHYGKCSKYSRIEKAPEGENVIVMFKSCYPNSNITGSINNQVPTIGQNLLKGMDCNSEYHKVENARGIYIDLLEYFKTRQDKLFIAITAPPVTKQDYSINARDFNNWLALEWLKDYPYKNVGIFDLYDILTGGTVNVAKYPMSDNDSHPNPLGNRLATDKLILKLNIIYRHWSESHK